MPGANKTDHSRTPQTNPLSAAKALATALPGNEPLVSLNALAGHLDRMRSQDLATPAQAFEICTLIERAGKPHVDTASARYLSRERRLTRFQEDQLWTTVTAYIAQLSHAYRHCLAKYQSGAHGSEVLAPSLALICGRAMRLGATRIKWSLLRYRRLEATQWTELCALYRFAESGGFARERLLLYGPVEQRSSVEEEFLKALMLAIGNPQSLLPQQIEIAHRLIATTIHRCIIGGRKSDRVRHYIDLSNDLGPRRIEKDSPQTTGIRTFGAGHALAYLETLLAEFEEEALKPTTRRLVREFDAESVRATLRHLLQHWGPTPPLRRHKRETHDTHVSVLHDAKEIIARVAGLSTEYPFAGEPETWMLDNESRSGLRASVASPQGQWLRIGALVGLRKFDEATWRTGVVRRLSERSDASRSAGIEIMGRGGVGVTFLPLNTRAKHEPSGLLCALLATGGAAGDEVTLLLPPGTYSADGTQEMRAYDKRYRLVALRLVASGEGYEIGRYRVLRIDAS